ncbi:PREDICTED: pre-mRNA-splicing factor CWC22 homolog, partial [Wasmannia auropunctata]|uniref:pre-mRNA-splicing factor CWC22 homolog n=1 Tax=Wasmannia auropunctata TaxID=64793 RepID=UPI0005EE6C10
MKLQLKPGLEIELCHMVVDCCAETRTYEKFFGLLAGRLCAINKMYITPFEQIFKDAYHTIHRLDTNKLRNVSKFFAHLLFTDSISWSVLSCVKTERGGHHEFQQNIYQDLVLRALGVHGSGKAERA